jgi:hypothetical protein
MSDPTHAHPLLSHDVLGMKTSLNENVLKGFRKSLDMAFLPFLKF